MQPVVKPYPEAPDGLLETPKPLVMLDTTATLIDVSEAITTNYSLYHELSAQLEALQNWVKLVREASLNVDGNNKTNK